MHAYRWRKYKSHDLPPRKTKPKEVFPEGIVKRCKHHGDLGEDQVSTLKTKKIRWGGECFSYSLRCKQCSVKNARKWQRANKSKVVAFEEKRKASSRRKSSIRARNLKQYGLTIECYDRIHENQGGLCAICNKPESSLGSHGKVKGLSVDHCHATGKVRGLLCTYCNPMIGYAKDNVAILKRAIEYLT